MCTLKILTDLCSIKQKIKIKNGFARVVCSVLVVNMLLIKHKEDCLSVIGLQSVKVEERTIEFENYLKQIPVPFKNYANFGCNLKSVEVYEGSYTKKYHDHVPCSFAYKIACIDNRFS